MAIDREMDGVILVIEPRPRDLGGFTVRRLLPAAGNRMVGPFIFLDHMGPAVMKPGAGMDVRPHPHIALATVTYLFEGQILHRDTLGNELAIDPGDVNWMLAGRGIAHSERSSAEERARALGAGVLARRTDLGDELGDGVPPSRLRLSSRGEG